MRFFFYLIFLITCFSQTGCLGFSSRLSEVGTKSMAFSLNRSELPEDFILANPDANEADEVGSYYKRSRRDVSASHPTKHWQINKTISINIYSGERKYPSTFNNLAFFPKVQFYYPYGEYEYGEPSRTEIIFVDSVSTNAKGTTCHILSPFYLRGTYEMDHVSETRLHFGNEWRSIGGTAAQLLLPVAIAADVIVSPLWLTLYVVLN